MKNFFKWHAEIVSECFPLFLQEIKTGRQAKARDSMPEGGPRDLTLSESLASKLLYIECTLLED